MTMTRVDAKGLLVGLSRDKLGARARDKISGEPPDSDKQAHMKGQTDGRSDKLCEPVAREAAGRRRPAP